MRDGVTIAQPQKEKNDRQRDLACSKVTHNKVDAHSVKVYTVNGAAAGYAPPLPDFFVQKRAAKAKGKRAIREHVESTIGLIQHFEFPEASNRVKSTRDGHHVIVTGTYKPQMRVWDLDQVALKFERRAARRQRECRL